METATLEQLGVARKLTVANSATTIIADQVRFCVGVCLGHQQQALGGQALALAGGICPLLRSSAPAAASPCTQVLQIKETRRAKASSTAIGSVVVCVLPLPAHTCFNLIQFDPWLSVCVQANKDEIKARIAQIKKELAESDR